MNFEILNNFLLFKTNRNIFFKNGHNVGPGPSRGYSPWGVAACHARLAERLGWASAWRPTCQRRVTGGRDGAVARSSASRCSPRVPVGPGVASGNVAVGGAHPGSGLMVGGRGEKVVAHRRFEAPVGSGSQRGGQRDPAATGERERSEGLAG
jgi:hypothetical protein